MAGIGHRKLEKLNASDTCGCGRRKDPAMQWCEHCYALLPPMSKLNYRRRVIVFQSYLARLQEKIAKEPSNSMTNGDSRLMATPSCSSLGCEGNAI